MCFPSSPEGGAAGGRSRRAAASVQRGGPHHLQDAAGAGGRRAVPPRTLHPPHISEEPGQHGAEEQETHVCAAAQRVSPSAARCMSQLLRQVLSSFIS